MIRPFSNYPYQNLQDLNLDFLLKEMDALRSALRDYLSLNTIEFADPINWDITSQYPRLTVVLDNSGGAYISRKPVPAGIPLTNTEYWTEIYNTVTVIDSIRDNVAHNNGDIDTATELIAHGNLFWYAGDLYVAVGDITAGNRFVVGVNCQAATVDEKINLIRGSIQSAIAAEATARQEADTALGNQIAQEATARQEADTALGNQIGSADSSINTLFRVTRKLASVKNVLVVGDSYSVSGYLDPWVNYMTDFFNRFENLAVSGASFMASDPQYKFITQIEGYTGNKNEVTDILVVGGLNDSIFSDPLDYGTTLNDAMKAFNDYVDLNYPQAEITLAYIGNGIDTSPLLSGRTVEKRMACLWAYETTAMTFGWNFIRGMECALSFNVLALEDGVHPSSIGAQQIARMIKAYFANYTTGIFYPRQLLYYGQQAYYSISEDMMDVSFEYPGITAPIQSGTTISGPSVEVLSGLSLQFNQAVSAQATVDFVGFDGVSHQSVNCLITLMNRSIHIGVNEFDAQGNYKSLTAGSNANVRISNVSFNFPAMYCA